MNRHNYSRGFLILIAGAAILSACSPPAPEPTPTPTALPTGAPIPATEIPQAAAAPAAIEPTPIGPYGPTNFPADVDPLTGLPVDDPATLNRLPILIKVSNESDVVRPQSGWSFADHVWEYQMEGFAQTRYTAVMYGKSAERVGSVRSARLIDVEHLVDMYSGILVFSGGSTNFAHDPPGPPRIRELVLAAPWRNRAMSEQMGFGPPNLVRIPDIPRPGIAGYHTLFAIPDEIWKWAEQQGFTQRPNLDGLAFDVNPPAGGTQTTEMIIDYPGIGPKHTWHWDEGRNAWLSSTDDQPSYDTLVPDVQVAFPNVVILYVPHYQADFLEQEGELGELYSVGIELTGEGDAVILRNGQRYTATWHRVGTAGMLQFTDAAGATIPLTPGQVFFNTADTLYFAPNITFTP